MSLPFLQIPQLCVISICLNSSEDYVKGMNLIELQVVPSNIETYIKAPEQFRFDEFVANLEALIREGTANIEIEECAFSIIKDLEDLILENGYIVQFIPIPGMTAHAHFFLERPS